MQAGSVCDDNTASTSTGIIIDLPLKQESRIRGCLIEAILTLNRKLPLPFSLPLCQWHDCSRVLVLSIPEGIDLYDDAELGLMGSP